MLGGHATGVGGEIRQLRCSDNPGQQWQWSGVVDTVWHLLADWSLSDVLCVIGYTYNGFVYFTSSSYSPAAVPASLLILALCLLLSRFCFCFYFYHSSISFVFHSQLNWSSTEQATFNLHVTFRLIRAEITYDSWLLFTNYRLEYKFDGANLLAREFYNNSLIKKTLKIFSCHCFLNKF